MQTFSRLALSALAAALLCGCELVSNDDGAALAAASGGASKSSKKSASKSTAIAGTWFLKEKNGTGSWYAIFSADGTWVIKDTPSAARNRVHGTYTVKENSFSGPMTNPGVGTGEISGTFSGNSMDFTFVEHWHTPHKTILYAGTRQ